MTGRAPGGVGRVILVGGVVLLAGLGLGYGGGRLWRPPPVAIESHMPPAALESRLPAETPTPALTLTYPQAASPPLAIIGDDATGEEVAGEEPRNPPPYHAFATPAPLPSFSPPPDPPSPVTVATTPPAEPPQPQPQPQRLAALPAPPRPVMPPPPRLPGEPAAWERFAVPFTAPPGALLLAVVIDDLGLDRRRTERTIALPGPLTLAFLPYAQDLEHQTRRAHQAGHELLLHMPMEPVGGQNPGPGALLTALPAEENLHRLTHALASFPGMVGVNNHMGSRFTSNHAALAPILTAIQAQGLLFLDSRTTGASTAPALATGLGLPFAGRDVFLDDDLSPAAVQASLARTEAVARRHGAAVAIGHPHDVTLAALQPWLARVTHQGFVLAPISAIVRRHRPSSGATPMPVKGTIP